MTDSADDDPSQPVPLPRLIYLAIKYLPTGTVASMVFISAMQLMIHASKSKRSPKLPLTTTFRHNIKGEDLFDRFDPETYNEGRPVEQEKFWKSVTFPKIILALLSALASALQLYTCFTESLSPFTIFDTVASVYVFGLTSAYLWSRDLQTHSTLTGQLCFLFGALTCSAVMENIVPYLTISGGTTITQHSPPLLLPETAIALMSLISFLAVSFIPSGPDLHIKLKLMYTSTVVASIEKTPELEESKAANVTREGSVSSMGKVFCSYAWKIIKSTAAAEQVDIQDLPAIPITMRALNVMRDAKWDVKHVSTINEGDSPSAMVLIKQIWFNMKGVLLMTLVLWMSGTAIYYVPHFCLQKLIESMEGTPNRAQGVIFGAFLILTRFGRNMLLVVMWRYTEIRLDSPLVTLLQGRLFQKLLTRRAFLPNSSDEQSKKAEQDTDKTDKADKKEEKKDDLKARSRAEILTLITTDVAKVKDLAYSFLSVFTTPAELLIGTFYIYTLLGVSAMVGLATLAVLGPAAFYLSKWQYRIYDLRLKAKDKKMEVMNEMIQSISNVKTFAFEDMMEKRVMNARDEEFRLFTRANQVGWASSFFYSLAPVAIILVSFWHFAFVRGESLTPALAFTTIVVFGELRYILLELPRLLTQILEELLACRRVQSFLDEPDLQERFKAYQPYQPLEISDATLTWSPPSSGWKLTPAAVDELASQTFVLRDISAIFPRGSISLITGRIGAGKTLLLHGLLGEAEMLSGFMNFPEPAPMFGAELVSQTAALSAEDWLTDSLAYVPQTAWLKSVSIRENICGHLPMSEERYKAVVAATGLLPDLALLEDSDLTQIGERGKVLSGGQKARVSLARAVYSRARTLVLDDCLSAVDTHTAAHIVEHVFRGSLVEGRTIIIVSHAVDIICPIASYAVVLEGGRQIYAGSPENMPRIEEGESTLDPPSKGSPSSEVDTKTLVGKPSPKSDAAHKETTHEELSDDKKEETLANEFEIKVAEPRTPRQLVLEEIRRKGLIAASYWNFLVEMSGGALAWVPYIVILLCLMGAPVFERGVLSTWSEAADGTQTSRDTAFYLKWYFAACMASICVGTLSNIAKFYLGLHAMQRIHHKMLHAVLHAKLRFFTQTTAGRIISRFTSDIDKISDLTGSLGGIFQYLLNVAMALLSISWAGNYWFAIVAAVLLISAWRTSFVHRAASRDLTRLTAVTKGPINTGFGETIAGITVLRAFGMEACELRELAGALNVYMVADYWKTILIYWLWAAMRLMDAFLITTAVTIILLAPGITAARAGFILAFADDISLHVNILLNRIKTIESDGVSLERTKEYCDLPDEDIHKNSSTTPLEPIIQPPAAWPTRGRIEFKDLVVRYAPELQDVLHGISFVVEGGTRVGVVGSTGSGKSTLAKTCFRFLEVQSGSIEIDGIDISQLTLSDLRTRLSIVPQDPVILSGTLRSALDVMGEFSDAELFAVLRQVQLIPTTTPTQSMSASIVTEAPSDRYNAFRSLETEVKEGGSNFSAGEKQLLVLARTILRSQKVLLMDEATSSMDAASDQHITETIRTGFPDATMLIIAHRLKTIMDCDKVLVLEKGRVEEFDTPHALLQNEQGRFHQLCRASGDEEFKSLAKMAEDAHAGKSRSEVSSLIDL